MEPSGQEKEGRAKNTWRLDPEADITQTGQAGKNGRGSPRTGDAGEMLCMAYDPEVAKGLSK